MTKAKKKVGGKGPTGRLNGGRTEYVAAHITPECRVWLREESERAKTSESSIVAELIEAAKMLAAEALRRGEPVTELTKDACDSHATRLSQEGL